VRPVKSGWRIVALDSRAAHQVALLIFDRKA
jgi:hypothetical protein